MTALFMGPSLSHASERPCVCGTYVGTLVNGKCQYSAATGSSCGSGQFACNPSIYSPNGTPKDALCVPDAGNCTAKANSCLQKFKKEFRLNDASFPKTLKKDELDKYNNWAFHVYQEVHRIKTATISSNKQFPSVESYCKTAPNDGDCKVLDQVNASVQTHALASSAAANYKEPFSQYNSVDSYKEWTKNQGNLQTNFPDNKNQDAAPAGPGSDCWERARYLDPLSCVACGLESFTGKKGVDRYVALLGVMAQAYQGKESLKNSESIWNLQRKVIEMIADNGYCTNAQYGGDVSSRDQKAIQSALGTPDRHFSLFGSGLGNRQKEAYKALGIQSDNRSYSLVKEIFDDNHHGEGPGLQQKVFDASAEKMLKNAPNAAINRCFKAMKSNRVGQPAWNICPRKCTQKPHQLMRCGMVYNAEGQAANFSLYDRLAQACAIPPKKRNIAIGCETWSQVRSGGGNNGNGPGPSPGKGGEADGGRGGSDPGGKGGETSGGRGGSDPGGGSPGGPGGGGGKGGEAGGTR